MRKLRLALRFFSFDWLFLILAAPLIGSFLGVVATRLPVGGAIIFGRSACPQCNHRLAVYDLVPIASWLLQRRRCRYCAAPIDAFYPLMEVGALIVALSAALVYSGWVLWISCVFGWALLTIAAIDYRYMTLPDELTLPLIVAGLGSAYFLDPDDLLLNVIGAVAGFVIFYFLRWAYRQIRGHEGLGLGDAKLLAASGAWVSFVGLPSVVLLGATAGLLVVITSAFFWGGRRLSAYDKVPFGSYLCLGTWFVWLLGPVTIPIT